MPVWATLKYKVCLGEGSVLELFDNSKMSQWPCKGSRWSTKRKGDLNLTHKSGFKDSETNRNHSWNMSQVGIFILYWGFDCPATRSLEISATELSLGLTSLPAGALLHLAGNSDCQALLFDLWSSCHNLAPQSHAAWKKTTTFYFCSIKSWHHWNMKTETY